MYAGQEGRGGARSRRCSRGRCIPTRTGLLASVPRLRHVRRDVRSGRAAAGNSRHGAVARPICRRAARSRRAAPLRDDRCRRADSRLTRTSGPGIGPPAGTPRAGSAMPDGSATPTAAPSSKSPALKKHFPVRKGLLRRTCRARSLPSTASASKLRKARRWAWSAKAAAAKSTVARTAMRLIEPTSGTIQP